MPTEIKIVFPTENAKRVFAHWLCDGGGEQDYFRALEIHGDGASVRLSYHPEDDSFPRNDKRRYGGFLADNTIRVIPVSEE